MKKIMIDDIFNFFIHTHILIENEYFLAKK